MKGKISIRSLARHIDLNVSPLFKAAYICWEWVLQAYDCWYSSENNFTARLPDFVEKFNTGNETRIQDYIRGLLSVFYQDVSSVSETVEPISQQALLQRFLSFDTILENVFTLPLVRALNYSHIFKLFETMTPVDHADLLNVSKAQKSLLHIVRPILKRVKEYHRVEEFSKELPDHLRTQVGSTYECLQFLTNPSY